MGKENEITSEGFAGGKPTNDRITARQALGLVEAHKGCIQKASPAAWDKIEVFFDRFQQVEDELRDAKSNIEPSLERIPLKDLRGAVIVMLERSIHIVYEFVNSPDKRPPNNDEFVAMGALLSVAQRYLSSIKDA